MMSTSRQAVDIVLPVFNESGIITTLYENLSAAVDPLPYRFRIIFVDDGSKDDTALVLRQIAGRDERVTVIELSRNFGHQAALTAGLDAACGDFIITMDADGQHPPALIPRMLQMAENGCDIVLTQRVEEKLPWMKRVTSAAFYRLINRLGDTRILPGSADFRLVSRPVLEAIKRMPEYHRFLRGMVAWVGYDSVILPYTPDARLGGESKYSLRKMLRLAADAMFSFSLIPLFLGISLGALFLVLALVEVIYVSSFWVLGLQTHLAAGWSSLMFMLLVVGGILMILLGFIGVYVGYIFQEVKRRPIYLVKKTTSIDGDFPRD
jgi:dolichol-phosphate mannosyltransferase